MTSPKAKIMIADDDLSFIESAMNVLNEEYDLYPVHTPEEVYESINNDIDILLLDMVFDESRPKTMQGLDVISHVKKYYPDILIIVMTNHFASEVATKTFNLGADDYINKKNLKWIEWINRFKTYIKLAPKGDGEYMGLKKDLFDIENALKASNGKKDEAAKILNKTPDWMLYRVKKKALSDYPELLVELPLIMKYYKINKNT